MKNKLGTSLLGAGALLLLQAAAFGQEYHSNDLTPAGSPAGRLNGASSGRQVGAAIATTGYSHAVAMTGNALTAVDLHPAAGYYYSMAMCGDDFQQGGWGYSLYGGIHALVWNGSSSAYADLNPSGYNFSYCLGVHRGEQVGYAQNQSYFITASHAMAWYGFAASAVDLHPAWTYPFSRATGIHDGGEVGYVSSLAYPDGDSQGYHASSHAVRWSGTAASAVDLHPAGYDASEATCANGLLQGGWAYLAFGTSHQHAMVWAGDAASYVDLHPAAFTDSKVTALTATQQVGEGWIGAANAFGSARHALLWSGTPASVVDLNQYLPAGYTNAVATGIDANGNVVGYAYNGYSSGLNIPAGAISVVFAPGAAAASGLSVLALTPATGVRPGDIVRASVNLGAPAPAGGVPVDFLSLNTNLLATPASILIAEGQTNSVFDLVVGGDTLQAPTSVKLYATDGSVSRSAGLVVTPVVKLASVGVNPVEGGFSTYGFVNLNIPAQAGGATVTLSSANPSLANVPANLTLPAGYRTLSFVVTTAPVTTATTVPITASFDGTSLTANLSLSPAPVVSLAGLSAPEIVGGQLLYVTVSLNNFPRAAAGAVISLTSGDATTLPLPATATVPYGAYSVTLAVPTPVVSGRKGVSIKAVYNGAMLSTTTFVNPIPPVTLTQADYMLDTKMLKIQASTPYTNSILTYGGDPANGPFGTMQFELGVYKGSIILDTPPTVATVWSSVGGMASLPVTIRTGAGGGSTGTAGGGGGGTTTPGSVCKLTLRTVGKGTVTQSPAGTSFAPGTQVALTATPDAGSPWIGWSGDATGTTRTITITMNKAMTVQANFK